MIEADFIIVGTGAGGLVAALHASEQGKVVMITLASAQDFMGERGEFEAEPDQNGLDFEAGSDVVEAEGDEEG